MNNKWKAKMPNKEAIWGRFSGKIRDIAIIFTLAFALLLASWKIFQTDEDNSSVDVVATEAELKVIRLLEEIDGVGEANVIVFEEDDVKNVVVVCEGANNLRVVMNVREAVAAALGTEKKAVKIYLKNSERR